MAVAVNSNIASLNAQRRLSEGSKKLEASFQKLSSGLRINRASDDASGLAISQLLNVDARVFTQGVRNFNDGLSVLSIAEGALDEATNIVTRIRELATQSANGTLTFTQRQAIGQEANALTSEYNRIINSTSFNGRKILDGSLQDLTIQGSYGTNGGISFGVGDQLSRAESDGTYGEATSILSIANSILAIGWGDFNGDGNSDQFINDMDADQFYTILGNGDGTFLAVKSFYPGFDINAFTEMQDLNGDGFDDLVGYTNSQNAVFLSNGDGTFRAPTYFSLPNPLFNFNLADFNNDSNVDIVNYVDFTTAMSVQLGNGDGTFRNSLTFDTSQQYASMAFGDINNDGNIDYFGATNSQTYGVAFGRGDGTFANEQTLAGNIDAVASGLADFNGDGHLDAAVSSLTSGAIDILLGNGDGTFEISTIVASGVSNSFLLNAQDLTGDGIVDLSLTSGSLENVLLQGNGDGTFRNALDLAVGDFVLPMIDANNDNVVDLTIVSASNTIDIKIANVTQVTTLGRISLFSRQDALDAMSTIDAALDRVTSERGAIGSAQSRMSTALNNLVQSSENFRSASSRITDADVAEESAGLLRNRILQQAAAAVLAQANQLPALALDLLRI